MIKLEKQNRNLTSTREYLYENIQDIESVYEEGDKRKDVAIKKQIKTRGRTLKFSEQQAEKIDKNRETLLLQFVTDINDIYQSAALEDIST